MRSKKGRKSEIAPDKKFGSTVVAKLINYTLRRGKKRLAERIVYSALDQAATKLNKDIISILDQVIKNVSPIMEVRAHRVGGATYQVPIEVAKHRRLALTLRWILTAARERKGQDMATRLAQELISAYNNEGAAVKKRSDVHKMAEANRAFAHLARYHS